MSAAQMLAADRVRREIIAAARCGVEPTTTEAAVLAFADEAERVTSLVDDVIDELQQAELDRDAAYARIVLLSEQLDDATRRAETNDLELAWLARGGDGHWLVRAARWLTGGRS